MRQRALRAVYKLKRWQLHIPCLFLWLFLCLFFWPFPDSGGRPTAFAQADVPTPAAPLPSTQNDSAVTAESVQVRRVKVNFFINSIYNIDDESGTYVIDFWLDLFWRDPALDGRTVDEVDPATLWNPQVRMLNAGALSILYASYSDSFEPDTNVYLSQRMVGTFTENFDLRRFPFDSQWLVIKLESGDYDSNQLLFDFLGSEQTIIYSENPFTFPLPLGKYLSNEFALSEWTIETANVIQQIHVLPYDKSSWAQFRVEIAVERLWRPYVLKIMTVFFLIMVLGATAFAIAVTDLRYRLLLLFTLLLTAIIFNFTRLQASPRTPYLTLLDLQALLSYLLLGLAIGAVVLVALYDKRGQPAATQWLNLIVVSGYIGLVLLCNLGLGWYGFGG